MKYGPRTRPEELPPETAGLPAVPIEIVHWLENVLEQGKMVPSDAEVRDAVAVALC
ncbi:MAG: hypothetical protein ACRD0H_11140 [Actinomycetes bacterium]